eukprot:4203667-Prymnesium_polylepis.3
MQRGQPQRPVGRDDLRHGAAGRGRYRVYVDVQEKLGGSRSQREHASNRLNLGEVGVKARVLREVAPRHPKLVTMLLAVPMEDRQAEARVVVPTARTASNTC